jgi:hypothetical protein
LSAYHALRQAVRARGGIATAWEVQRELLAYLGQFKVKAPNGIVWSDIYTREEYHALVNRRKKRKPKRKRNEHGELVMQYESIGLGTVEAAVTGAPKLVVSEEDYRSDLDWIDAFARREYENEYHGEF